jgi:hypothetical protein
MNADNSAWSERNVFTRSDAEEAAAWTRSIVGDVRMDGTGDAWSAAIHESGHMLVTLLTGGSFTQATMRPSPFVHDCRSDSVDDRLCVLLAGLAAEQTRLGRVQPAGAWGDLSEARGRALMEQRDDASDAGVDERLREQFQRARDLVAACPGLVATMAGAFLEADRLKRPFTFADAKRIASAAGAI